MYTTCQTLSGRTRRREDLRDFLRNRRSRLSPEDVALPSGGTRRTPGLRREEVALLAGIGLSWYTYLEQGRDITVTPRVLDGISSALRLDVEEHVYLYHLAGLPAPEHASVEAPRELPEMPRLILDEWNPHPGYALDRHWRFLGGNAALHSLFGHIDRHESCLDAFHDHRFRTLLSNWEQLSAHLVSRFRADAARYPEDVEFDRIASRLSARSTEFTALWAEHEVSSSGTSQKIIQHVQAGTLTYTRTTMQVAGHPETRLVLLVPHPETRSKLADLHPWQSASCPARTLESVD